MSLKSTASVSPVSSAVSQRQKTNSYPLRAPRFWHGMRAGQWWSMLFRHGFRISPSRMHLALGCTVFTPINDLLGALQHVRFGSRIARAQLTSDPVFVLGHWRSGTTLMHELLVLDEQFASPSTYACFAPWHFLVSESLMTRYGSWLIPDKRPMDNMRAGWDKPQEDEFALMNLGAPTPYMMIAFPNDPAPWTEFIDMSGISSKELELWQRKFLWFIRALTVKHNKQLVLKSPPHTGRVAELVKLFPNARFIHMVRDPRKLFASTLRLWQSLIEVQGMQKLRDDQPLRAYIWDCLVRMYQAFETSRSSIPADRLIDVHYEQLIAHPVDTMRHVYEQLKLGDFSKIQHAIEQRFANDREYKVNEHAIDSQMEAAVLSNWGDYARRYGYQ